MICACIVSCCNQSFPFQYCNFWCVSGAHCISVYSLVCDSMHMLEFGILAYVLCVTPRRGQLGNGDPSGGSVYSPPVAATLVGIAQVSCGSFFTCVRALSGSVVCFGWNFNGQCGLDPAVNPSVLLPPTTPVLEGVLQVSVGSRHTCALADSPLPGSVYCWVSHLYCWSL